MTPVRDVCACDKTIGRRTLLTTAGAAVLGYTGHLNAAQDDATITAHLQTLVTGWEEMQARGVSGDDLASVDHVLAVSARLGLIPDTPATLPLEWRVRANDALRRMTVLERQILAAEMHRGRTRRTRARTQPALDRPRAGEVRFFLAQDYRDPYPQRGMCEQNRMNCDAAQAQLAQFDAIIAQLGAASAMYATAAAYVATLGPASAPFLVPLGSAAAISGMLMATLLVARGEAQARRDRICGLGCAQE